MVKILITYVIVVVYSSSLISFPGHASSIPPKLRNFIEKLEAKKNTLQGGAIAILYKGQVIYKTTFGKQKGTTGNLITAHTLFPLASVSKTVSVAALALMADRGILDFNEVFKLPYLKNPVNLRNILSHTTGYKFSGNVEIEEGIKRKNILEKIKGQKPQCKPSACYSYSNTLFSLVEEALHTKNLSFQSALQQLGMALDTDELQIVPLDPHMSIAYPHFQKKDKIQPLPFPPYYPKAAPAAAGIFASLDAMIKVFQLSFGYRPDLISQKTLNKLYTPSISNRDINKWNVKWPCVRSKIDSYYGLGWRILKSREYPDKDLIFHAGFIAGATPFIGFIPSEHIGIIILVNQSSRKIMESGLEFWGTFL